ncbi:MAG: hypothetical protein IKR96_03465 [Bacteroidales bacterium]|nr:hypothetical protein [Bacteroidales bacterium]
MGRLKRIVSGILVLASLSGCKFFGDVLHNEPLAAKVGSHELTMAALRDAVPDGLTPEDSAAFAERYINSWARDMLLMDRAEKSLSAEEKDVSAQLEDYRRTLLNHRYEQKYIAEHLDSLVTREEIEDYYAANREKFRLQNPVVKAYYFNISPRSKELQTILSGMTSTKEAKRAEADTLMRTASMRFVDYSANWVDAYVLAREFNTDVVTLLSSRKKEWIRLPDGLGHDNVAFLIDYVPDGSYAPVDYCTKRIEEIILSARKHALSAEFETKLIEEALESEQLIIY